MKRFRRNAVYAIDSFCFTPIDRNQRVLIMRAAEALELRTKGKGCKSGVLMQSGLRVIHCLLFVFSSVPSGRCCPSYEAIREATGFCKNTTAPRCLAASSYASKPELAITAGCPGCVSSCSRKPSPSRSGP